MEGHVHPSPGNQLSGFWSLFEVYVPRRQCMFYEADVIWLHLISDLLIAAAYFSIPVALILFARRRKDLEFDWMFMLFALFIILCGTTHLFGVLALWYPLYRLDGVIKLLTGCTSIATALLLWRLLPKALALASPEQLRVLNQELSLEVAERKKAEAEFRQLNETLEKRVDERAAQLANTASELEAARKKTAESLALVDTLVMNAPVGIGLYDKDLRFVLLNSALAEINGASIEEHVGKRVTDLLPGLALDVQESMRHVLHSGEPILNQEVTGETLRYPGVTRNWRASYYPVQTTENDLLGVGIVVEDITEQKQTLDALRDSSRRKDEFLAMLSHELRNPLAPIRNASQVLKLVTSPDESVKKAQQMIERQVNHLCRLVDDLLDVSRISRGKITLQKKPIGLASVLTSALELSRNEIESRKHSLRVTLPPEPFVVDGDFTRLSQVFVNILINSAKYTADGGDISLTCTRDDDFAVITVRDNGIGIAPELLPCVFDLFTQAEQTLDRSHGGLGIGLTLVKKLIEDHGGTVEVESEGLGRGSQFTVRLPLLLQQSIAASGVNVTIELTPENSDSVTRILIVDDNVDAADSLAMLLRLSGKDVETAHEGVSAIDAALRYRPDIIFIDIGLPGMDGYEVARRLQQMQELAGLPLVALTGYGSERDRQRSAECGFSAHLVKPIDMGVLQEILNTLPKNVSSR